MIIRTIAQVLALLNSNSRAGEVGAGIAFGLLLALIPGGNLLFYLLFALAFFLKINLGLTIVSLFVFSIFIPLVDPALSRLGYWILTRPALFDQFTGAYATPVVPWTQFNNTLVMGGLAVGLIAYLPATLLFTQLVRLYRDHVHATFMQSKLVKRFTQIPLIQKLASATQQVRRYWPKSA
ncbi:MAG: TIGR03546 family protein [Spirochaetales bacterium]